MDQHFLEEIHHHNRSMMSMEKLLNLHHLLIHVLRSEVDGAVVELGCYRGFTALTLAKTMKGLQRERPLHLYDSFQGLPEKGEADLCDQEAPMRPCDRKDNQRLGKGWFAVEAEQIGRTFANQGVALPLLHKGWFEETLPSQLPDSIAFAHLDGDFYSSTLCGLTHLYPRLSPGAIVVLDDYCDVQKRGKQNTLPGVKAACDAFFADKPEQVHSLFGGFQEYQAYFEKEG